MIVALKVKVFLQANIKQEYGLIEVARMIDKTLCNDSQYKQLHERVGYKGYSFTNLSPVEKNGIYKRDEIYTFTLRTLDVELAGYLMDNLRHIETDTIKGLTVECWLVKKKPIKKMYSITPLIVQLETGGYWKNNVALDYYEKLLYENLIKKFNFFNNTKIDEDFSIWTSMQITNRTPVKFPYKDQITLLGDKIEMEIDQNPMAQEIAYMSLATGIGHLCQRGAGYFNYHIKKGG